MKHPLITTAILAATILPAQADYGIFQSGGAWDMIIPVALYLLPTLIAASKHRENVGAIFAVNLVLGWTFIGWFVAFVWALTHAPRRPL